MAPIPLTDSHGGRKSSKEPMTDPSSTRAATSGLADPHLLSDTPPLVDHELDPARSSPLRLVLRGLIIAFVAFMVLGNVAVAVTSLVAQRHPRTTELKIDGVHNGFVVDDQLWRGGAPSPDGYRSLAAAEVTTIVDLRAERDLGIDEQLLREEGLKRVHIPIRDGQRPSDAQLARFAEVMASEPGRVFVHCGAGVGRTGAVIGAYRALRGEDSLQILRDNLAAGPPSLEQLSYMFNSTVERAHDPHPALVAASRVLDAPRRMWSYVK